MQSLLEAYVKDDSEESIESVSLAFGDALDNLKRCGEARVNASARFEYSMASVCFEASHCLTHLKSTIAQMTLFVENSIKKWNNYAFVYKEMLRVITMVSQPIRVIQNAQSTNTYLPRANKLATNSLFNVIHTNTPLISIYYENKAIVRGVNPRPPIPVEPTEQEEANNKKTTIETQQQPFRYDPTFRCQLEELTRSVIIAFESEKHKKRIYLAHYDRLGNFRRLAQHIEAVQEKLGLLANEINRLGGRDDDGDDESLLYIASMSQCLTRMPEMVRETKKNCKDFVFNTVDRFAECSATYERMIREICSHGLEFEEMRKLEECQETRKPEKTLFASMYASTS